MNSLFSIVHYEKLHTQILNVLRKNVKKKYSIYFLLYISLSKKSSHSYQGIWPVHVFSFRYYLDTSLKETLSNFTQIQFIGLGVLVVIVEPEVQPVAKPVSARPQVCFSLCFSRCIQIKFWQTLDKVSQIYLINQICTTKHMDRPFILNSHHDQHAFMTNRRKKKQTNKSKHSIWFSRQYKILYFIQFYPPQTTIPHDPSSKLYFRM